MGAVSDLDAALEPVRQILERRDAARANGSSEPGDLKRVLESAAALQQVAPANGAAEHSTDVDWAAYERNRAVIREVVKTLRNGRH